MENFRKHLPEYLMEAALLGLFLIVAGVFTILFEYPYSPIHQALPNGDLRRFLIGIAMGATAIALIYSPWGGQSGAHINPASSNLYILPSGQSQAGGCGVLYPVSLSGRIGWYLFSGISVWGRIYPIADPLYCNGSWLSGLAGCSVRRTSDRFHNDDDGATYQQ